MERFRGYELVLGFLFATALWIVLFTVYAQNQPQHSTNPESNQSHQSKSLWIPEDSIGFFTLWTAAFTGVLAFSTIRLWKATSRTAKIAEKALITTERAFIFIDGFNIELTTALDSDEAVDIARLPERYRDDPGIYITRFAAQPRWKNGGTTPTEQLTIQVNWRGPGGAIPPDYAYREPPEPFFLGPQAVEPSAYIEMPGAQALINWAMNPVGESPMMFIWGRADYRDVFGESHFVEWCYQLRLSRPIRNERLKAAFIQWGEYNRSDKSGPSRPPAHGAPPT